MKVRTKFFAAIKDIVGTPEVELELPDGITAGELFQSYCQQHASLSRYATNTMISVNLEFVPPETRLHEGDEIAFIPPVSGGCESGAQRSSSEGMAMIDILDTDIELEPLVQHVRKNSNGAVVTFLGVVRGFSRGRNVLYLEYEAYREMAVRKLQQVAEEVREKWTIDDIAMVHRVGHLEVGERSVAIAVGAPHRKVAFEACEYAIDRLKEIVPIWKKEVWEGGEAWIDDRP
jgi:MoaE-MoaD fusion protein